MENKKDNSNAAEEQNTHLMLDSKERKQEAAGSRSPFGMSTDLTIGKDRAKTMVQIIQDVEMKKALEKVTMKGNETLEKNPEIRTPIAIIAGAVSLWAGRTVRFFKSDDVQVSTMVEGRSRSGGFNMVSPLMNGQLKYSQEEGTSLGVNRSISSFNTSASMRYNMTNQSMSTQINQMIVPHLNFSVGTAQEKGVTEGSAQLNYELQF